MAKKSKAIILGWINEGNQAQCGETVKNQVIISQLRKLGIDVITLDFYRWKKRPWVVAKTLLSLLLNPKTPLILSSAPKNVYPFMKAHRMLGSKRKIIHWVIGGNLHKFVQDKTFDTKYLNALHVNIVETKHMHDTLHRHGVANALHAPNFKPIAYKPDIPEPGTMARFVFMSRIKPEKGVDYIIQSIETLNQKGLSDQFCVDFYGRIDDDYKEKFLRALEDLPNAHYRGFLDFNEKSGYDTLASYTAMLFPTYWISEGFAGIFIDAFIAGLPIIASDWAHNAEILTDGETGVLIPPHDAQAIAAMMQKAIDQPEFFSDMRHNCQLRADEFDAKNVVTREFAKKIGLLP